VARLIFFDKLRASRYLGWNRHINYVGSLIHFHPLTIVHIIIKKKKIYTETGGHKPDTMIPHERA
jgi:hypothetical protein